MRWILSYNPTYTRRSSPLPSSSFDGCIFGFIISLTSVAHSQGRGALRAIIDWGVLPVTRGAWGDAGWLFSGSRRWVCDNVFDCFIGTQACNAEAWIWLIESACYQEGGRIGKPTSEGPDFP